MAEKRLYAIVLRLRAIRAGAIAADHGDQARAALFNLIKQADSPLAKELHDEAGAKPYTISLLQGGRIGKNKLQNFAEGDTADWRFSLLTEAPFELLFRNQLLQSSLPAIRIATLPFAIEASFASGHGHPDTGHISVQELSEKWNCAPETLSRRIVLDFRSPTAFNLGQDKETKEYHIRSSPDSRTMFSSLRKRWARLGGVDMGDEFDQWVAQDLELEPIEIRTQSLTVEKRSITGFIGRLALRLQGRDLSWLPYLHLLTDLSFWTGIGYQTTRGMGQVRRVSTD